MAETSVEGVLSEKDVFILAKYYLLEKSCFYCAEAVCGDRLDPSYCTRRETKTEMVEWAKRDGVVVKKFPKEMICSKWKRGPWPIKRHDQFGNI